MQHENKWGLGDAGSGTPQGPWCGCSGSPGGYSLPGGPWRNMTLWQQLYKETIPKETIIQEVSKAVHVYVT